ncbi:MAG: metal ABC transporter substrate-binding protein [Planctomycetota bacterium]
MPRLLPTPLAALAAAALAACGGDASTERSARGPRANVVAVASGPAALLAGALVGGELVRSVAPAGTRMADWRPDDEAIRGMVDARRLLVVGGEFEPWLQRTSVPPSRTVALSDLVPGTKRIEVGAIEHTHGDGESHSHGGVVPTIWTDPAQLRAAIDALAESLPAALDGVERANLQAPRAALLERVAAYEASLAELGAVAAGRPVIATDHGLEYVARAAELGLEVALLELDGDGPPNDQGVRDLERLAKDSGSHAGVLVWPGPIDAAFAERVREQLGLVSVHFDLGGEISAPDEGDALERLTASVEALRGAIQESRPR